MWQKAKRHVVTVVLALAVGALAAMGVGLLRGETYRAEASYVITSDSVLLSDEVDALVQTLTSTFESRRIAAGAVEGGDLLLSVDDVWDGLSMSSRPRSALLVGSFEDEDPDVARSVLEAASETFLAASRESNISGGAASGEDQSTVSVDLFSAPETLSDPTSPSLVLLGIIGGLAGLILGLGVAVAREASRPRLDDIREAEEIFGPTAIDLTGPDSAERAARVLRSSVANLDAAPILVAGPDGTSAARARFIDAAAGGLRDFGWNVSLVGSENQRGDPGRHPGPGNGTAPAEGSGTSSGLLIDDDDGSRLDVERLALATPEVFEFVRSDFAAIAETTDIIVVDLPFLSSSLPRVLTNIAQALIVVVPLGVLNKSEAAALAATVHRLEASIISDVVIVDSRGPLSG